MVKQMHPKTFYYFYMTQNNIYSNPIFSDKFVFRRVVNSDFDYARHLFWACNTSETFLLTLSNSNGALYHLFCDNSGLVYLDDRIVRYCMSVPAISEFVFTDKDAKGRFRARIPSNYLSRACFHDKSIYLLLLNSPWGCSEGIFSHYYEEFVPFLHELSKLSSNLTGCSSAPIWLSWRNRSVQKTTWRVECDDLLFNRLGLNMPQALYALESPNTSILRSAGGLYASISKFRLKCVGWTPGSGICSTSAALCGEIDIKSKENGIDNFIILSRQNYSGERRWSNEHQCAEYLQNNSDACVKVISPEHYSTQELLSLIVNRATIITAPSSAIYPLIFFGSNANKFIIVDFPGQVTTFGGSLSGELSSYRLGLNSLRDKVFFLAPNEYIQGSTRASYSIRPHDLVAYLFSTGTLANRLSNRVSN